MLTSPRNIPTFANSKPKKSKEDYKFWKTQPVPDIGMLTSLCLPILYTRNWLSVCLILGEVITENEPVEPDVPVSEIRTESYSLPPGFEWCEIDLNDPKEVNCFIHQIIIQ